MRCHRMPDRPDSAAPLAMSVETGPNSRHGADFSSWADTPPASCRLIGKDSNLCLSDYSAKPELPSPHSQITYRDKPSLAKTADRNSTARRSSLEQN